MTCAKLTVRGSDVEDVFADIARVHLSHRPDIPAGQILALEHRGIIVPLVARGARGNKRGEIWLDLAVRKRLGLLLGETYDFQINPANWGERLRWAWSATNPAYRIASQISLVSFALGVIGLLLGILSLTKA